MIHYHGTPMTGGEDAWMALSGKHAMVSFANASQMAIVAELCQSFTIDNGAFTLWKSGGSVDLVAYKEFLEVWAYHPGFDWYLMPDVIEGTEADNNAIRAEWLHVAGGEMWERGVPVWHLHESIESLKYMCHAYNRVALGSSGAFADVGTRMWWDRMAEAMDAICDSDGRPRTKLHGLRMLDPTVFSHIPLSSADSTNVARNIGIDSHWTGANAPSSRKTRALILMERIERHASASRWCKTNGTQQNLALFG